MSQTSDYEASRSSARRLAAIGDWKDARDTYRQAILLCPDDEMVRVLSLELKHVEAKLHPWYTSLIPARRTP